MRLPLHLGNDAAERVVASDLVSMGLSKKISNYNTKGYSGVFAKLIAASICHPD